MYDRRWSSEQSKPSLDALTTKKLWFTFRILNYLESQLSQTQLLYELKILSKHKVEIIMIIITNSQNWSI